jgi:hypothetical protein
MATIQRDIAPDCHIVREVTPIPTIYEEELIKLRTPESNDDTRQIIEQLPTYYSCKTALYHQRSLKIPGLPRTTTEINLQYKWCLTTGAVAEDRAGSS